MIDSDDAYYLVRLDTLHEGGKPTFEAAKEDIRRELVRQKKLDLLLPKAQALVTAVRGGQTLEAAAQTAGLKVEKSLTFARATQVPALGQTTEAIGASFGAPVGSVAPPAKGQNNVIVLRVDKRTEADKAAFEKQKKEQRDQLIAARSPAAGAAVRRGAARRGQHRGQSPHREGERAAGDELTSRDSHDERGAAPMIWRRPAFFYGG